MNRAALLTLLYIAIMNSQSHAKDAKAVGDALKMQCPDCDKIICTPKNPRKLKCPGGITRGVCNCCPKCAKLEGDTCGGYAEYLGKCDEGLYCDYAYDTDGMASDYWHYGIPEGICRTVPEIVFPGDGLMQGDQPQIDQLDLQWQCKPECTPAYCEKNPRAICSARSNADEISECQEDCQHTSCRACRYVYSDSTCPKCSKDDFRCLKRYGTCVRQEQCHKDRFPCKTNKKDTNLAGEGVFQCKVPECS